MKNSVRNQRSLESVRILPHYSDFQLRDVLEVLAAEFPEINFSKNVSQELRSHASDILEEHLGFTLVRKASTIRECGRGVFVERGEDGYFCS